MEAVCIRPLDRTRWPKVGEKWVSVANPSRCVVIDSVTGVHVEDGREIAELVRVRYCDGRACRTSRLSAFVWHPGVRKYRVPRFRPAKKEGGRR